MTNIIGPISSEDWKTMSLLKGSIEFYRRQNNPKYTKALEKESEVYKYYLSKHCKGVGNDEKNPSGVSGAA